MSHPTPSSARAKRLFRTAASRARLFRSLSLNETLSADVVPNDVDTILCNPPRRGLDRPSVELFQSIRPPRVLSLSCNPATLQRDVALLESEYRLTRLTPFDMFPYTHHCEVFAMLERKIIVACGRPFPMKKKFKHEPAATGAFKVANC